ncbi:YihY/virulence factor BrkB family protein [Natrialbaceae archaeon AArc-T1-2]|uniref:YihY/virulence factor BrkB family protein n=1 Tax=Natrialbaceae archaeon AArc-T1-2 TaxID=3053904 RepID=UPI00255B06D9|nr:YihY/virulence factor BrkB family protein [Natrialbaceae archaeon AArc-T1-2]WIV67066.1 YihY/virulence factor BrkB family protein [Natrialbaceae archaeon AArc-T1-2]
MNARETLEGIYRTASDREITLLAAGFAYYAFVSLIPLVLLALVVGSLLGGEELAERLIDAAGDLLPAAGEDLVTAALTTEAGRAEASIVALAVATWGGLKVFRGLSKAFDEVYGTAGEDSLLEELRDGIVVVLAVAGAIALMIVIGVVLGIVADEIPAAGSLGWLALLLGLFLAFLPVYYVLPPVPVGLVEVVPGAAFAAVGWVVLQAGFQLYAANAARYEAYGAIGAVLLFVTWLYFAGILILLGAVINVVLARPDAAA